MMERGSAKHSPRVDDELDHEVAPLTHGAPDESRTEPRLQEAGGDDDPGLAVRRDVGGSDGTVLDDAVLDFRARLAASIPPSTFPANAAALQEAAREQNAAPDVLDALGAVSTDRVYEAFGELWDDLGGPQD